MSRNATALLEMPLAEMSSNLHYSDDYSERRAKPSYQDGNVFNFQQKPSIAIQGMLRTSTEMGDAVLFPPRTSGLPRASSHTAMRLPRSTSRNTAQFSHALNFGPRRYRQGGSESLSHTSSSVRLSKHDSERSNLISSHIAKHSGRTSHRRTHVSDSGPSHRNFSHDPRSYGQINTPKSNTSRDRTRQPLANSHSMYSRRSSDRLNSRSFNIESSIPSLSGVEYRRALSLRLKDSFPRSTNVQRSGHVNCSNHSISSDLIPQRVPPPVLYTNIEDRSPLPMPPSDSNASRIPGIPDLRSSTSINSYLKAPASSTSQFYYDYSEPFASNDDEDKLGRSSTSPSFIAGEMIPERWETPKTPRPSSASGEELGSKHVSAESPTNQNHYPSKESHISTQNSDKSDKNIPKTSRSTSASNGRGISISKESFISSMDNSHVVCFPRHRILIGETSQQITEQQPELTCEVVVHKNTPTLTPLKGRMPSTAGTFFTNADRSPRNLVSLVSRTQSCIPIDNAQESCSLDQLLEVASHKLCPETSLTQEPSVLIWNVPDLAFRPLSFETPANLRTRSPSVTSDQQALRKWTSQPSNASPRGDQCGLTEDRYQSASYQTENLRRSHSITCSAIDSPQRLSIASYGCRATPGEGTFAESLLSQTPLRTGDTQHENLARLSEVTSHDKSTIESLLERHIECLGLQSDAEHSSEEIDKVTSSSTEVTEATIKLSNVFGGHGIGLQRSHTSSSHVPTSLTSSDRQRLVPRRLFASLDAGVPDFQLLDTASEISKHGASNKCARSPSYGWQILPSESDINGSSHISQLSILSGEYADIDTTQQTKKFKLRTVHVDDTLLQHQFQGIEASGRQQPPVVSHREALIHANICEDNPSRKRSHRHRKMKIHMKGSTIDSNVVSVNDSVRKDPLPQLVDILSQPEAIIDGRAELSGDSTFASQKSLNSNVQTGASVQIQQPWSGSKLAAVATGKRCGLDHTRKASVRSQRSQNSITTIIDPVNSTRQSFQTQRHQTEHNTLAPKLAKPDFGPPLNSSTLHLSIPYPDISLIDHSLVHHQRSFIRGKPANERVSSLRQKFNFSSLRYIRPSLSGMQNQNTSTSSNSSRTSKSHFSKERPFLRSKAFTSDTVPMSDFSFRKHKVLDKVRGWWKRQCMQKRLSSFKRKSENGGILV